MTAVVERELVVLGRCGCMVAAGERCAACRECETCCNCIAMVPAKVALRLVETSTRSAPDTFEVLVRAAQLAAFESRIEMWAAAALRRVNRERGRKAAARRGKGIA